MSIRPLTMVTAATAGHIWGTSSEIRVKTALAPDPAYRPGSPTPARHTAMAACLPVQRLASERGGGQGTNRRLTATGNHLNAPVGDALNAIAHLPVDWRKGVERRGSTHDATWEDTCDES